jgi:hypothetical protein
MSVKKKYELIQYYQNPLNDIVKIIEIIDPIRNDTDTNNFKSYKDNTVPDGTDMIAIPRFKSWLIKIKNKFILKVHRQGGYEPIELELSREIIDSISESLCSKRDWYRNKIEEIDKSE